MRYRYKKKVAVNGTVVLHQHYLYWGYLQIAAIDLMRANAPTLWLLHWDPTQPVATRPLSLRKNATWYTYGHDLTKNVMELYTTAGAIVTEYDYTPYGTVTATGLEQPIQWSSEHYDAELALVYYNYRHYNPLDGRWINRDPIAEKGGRNLYGFVRNSAIILYDVLGYNDSRPKCRFDPKDYDIRVMGRTLDNRQGTISMKNGSTVRPMLTPQEAQRNMRAMNAISPIRSISMRVRIKFQKQDCHCCEVRQYVKLDQRSYDAQPDPKFIPSPNQFFEDIAEGTTYGPRNVPSINQDELPMNKEEAMNAHHYTYTTINSRKQEYLDFPNGEIYTAFDDPMSDALGVWTFELRVVDVCSEKSKKQEDVISTFSFNIDWNN